MQIRYCWRPFDGLTPHSGGGGEGGGGADEHQPDGLECIVFLSLIFTFIGKTIR